MANSKSGDDSSRSTDTSIPPPPAFPGSVTALLGESADAPAHRTDGPQQLNSIASFLDLPSVPAHQSTAPVGSESTKAQSLCDVFQNPPALLRFRAAFSAASHAGRADESISTLIDLLVTHVFHLSRPISDRLFVNGESPDGDDGGDRVMDASCLSHERRVGRDTTRHARQSLPSPPSSEQSGSPPLKRLRQAPSCDAISGSQQAPAAAPSLTPPLSAGLSEPRVDFKENVATVDCLQYLSSGGYAHVFNGFVASPSGADVERKWGVSLVIKAGTNRALFEHEAEVYAALARCPNSESWRRFLPKVIGLYVDDRVDTRTGTSDTLYLLVMEHCGWPAASGGDVTALMPRDR